MKNKKKYITWLTVFILAVIIAVIVNLFRDTFIIYLGVRVVQKLIAGIIIAGCILIALFILLVIRDIVKSRRASTDILSLHIDNVAKTADWREKMKDKLKLLMKPIASLKTEYEELMSDITSITTKRHKLEDLARDNNVDLVNVITVIENSDTTIFKNIQKALNCVMLWDTSEERNPAFVDIYKERIDYIDEVVTINNRILINCDKLLSETVRYINAKAEGLSDNDADIDSMQKTLQTLSNMNETIDDFKLHKED